MSTTHGGDRAPLGRADGGSTPTPSARPSAATGGGRGTSRPAAGPPVMDFSALDEVWPENVPTLYDHDADEVERFRDGWTAQDRRGVALVLVLIAAALIVGFHVGELYSAGWFR